MKIINLNSGREVFGPIFYDVYEMMDIHAVIGA